ncbi:MAG: SEL1-like repeat protein [Sphingobium sp.]|nr:SEL1-like repeat protein [Sphingobium sp.]MBP9158807.1 SEL1-like repeat protein [Sphingobium sp.]
MNTWHDQTRAALRRPSNTAPLAAWVAQARARIAKARAEGKQARRRALSLPALKSLFLSAALIASSACATSSYMGISLTPGASDAELQSLASRARAGDKHAQLELGSRFEEGRGVPVDRGRAKALYRQAASDSGGTMWIYMPSPGNGAKGRVVPMDRGPKRPGLDEAKKQLKTLIRSEGR